MVEGGGQNHQEIGSDLVKWTQEGTGQRRASGRSSFLQKQVSGETKPLVTVGLSLDSCQAC